jgi:hypothetical protein
LAPLASTSRCGNALPFSFDGVASSREPEGTKTTSNQSAKSKLAIFGAYAGDAIWLNNVGNQLAQKFPAFHTSSATVLVEVQVE